MGVVSFMLRLFYPRSLQNRSLGEPQTRYEVLGVDDDSSQHAQYEGVWGNEGTALLIPYLGITRNVQPAFKPLPFHPKGRVPDSS